VFRVTTVLYKSSTDIPSINLKIKLPLWKQTLQMMWPQLVTASWRSLPGDMKHELQQIQWDIILLE